MRRCIAFLLFAFTAAAPAFAVAVKTLPAVKGAQVWFSEDHTLPMIALSASFPAGSVYDPPAKSGTAAFAAALLDEGAGNLSAGAFRAALADRGIQLEVEVDRDVASVRLTTLSARAKDAFRLLGMALARPRFDGDAVARVRAQMLQNLEQDGEDPDAVARKGFYSLYFGPYTYGRPVDGDPHALETITPDELRVFARTHWVRGGLKIAVAGDTDAATLTVLLRTAFGALPGDTPPLPPAPGHVGAVGLHILRMEAPQPSVTFGMPGIVRNNPDFLAATIANYILGGGGSSRLATELRGKRGLTYDVATDLLPYRRAGLLLGQLEARRDTVRQCIGIVKETMRRFSVSGPTDQEFADAKQYLNGSFPLSLSSNADIAAQLNQFQQEGLPPDYVARRADLINAVSIDDVRRVARALFDPSRLTVVVAGTLPTQNTEAADSPEQ